MPKLACLAFVCLSVTISVIGAFSKGLLPGVLLTIGMFCCVYFLSISLGGIVAAWGRDRRRVAQTLLMAAGFALMETNLNHIGLDHLNELYELVPADPIDLYFVKLDWTWLGCLFISLVNVFATDTYSPVRAEPAPRKNISERQHIANLNGWLGFMKRKEAHPQRARFAA